jgi:hypothetical protein
MVFASERLKETGFKRVTKKRRGKFHLQFPLYTDEQIGFGDTEKFELIENSCDEDYETDKEILRRTILVCKQDCFNALRHRGKNEK